MHKVPTTGNSHESPPPVMSIHTASVTPMTLVTSICSVASPAGVPHASEPCPVLHRKLPFLAKKGVACRLKPSGHFHRFRCTFGAFPESDGASSAHSKAPAAGHTYSFQ